MLVPIGPRQNKGPADAAGKERTQNRLVNMTGFIEKHGLWSNDQRRQADEIKARVKADGLKLFRMAWADPHGASRAKTVTVPAFLGALENGYNINVATTTLDASGARTFAPSRGGGMGLDEMTGRRTLFSSPTLATFRVLPLGAASRLDPVR